MPSARPPRLNLRATCRSLATAVLMVALFGANFKLVWAQSTSNPAESSPWQRWLPPPKSLAPDEQARLLARLRDMVLSDDASKALNQPQLSEREVQSLKEAMKRFSGILPEGLSPESLDAIPPELISKALANPELRRQAKEMAEQYLKQDRSTPSANPSQPNNSPARKPSDKSAASSESRQPSEPKNSSNKQSSTPSTQQLPPPATGTAKDPNAQENKQLGNNQLDKSRVPSDPKDSDFKELMDKLLKTQEQFQRNKNGSNSQETDNNDSKLEELLKDFNGQPSNKDPKNKVPKEDDWSDLVPSESNKPNNSSQSTTRGASQSKNNQPKSTPPRTTTQGSTTPQGTSPSNPKPSQATPNPSGRQKQENNFNQQPTAADRGRFAPANPNDGVGNNGARNNGARKNQSMSSEDSNSNPSNRSSSIDSNATDPKDIRKELDKKGLGPTLQKMIDEARANIAKRPKTDEPKIADASKISIPKQNEGKNSAAQPISANQSLRSSRSPDAARTPPPSQPTPPQPVQPPKPDTEISKGIKQASTYLNNLWTQIATSSTRTTRERSDANSESASSVTTEALSLPDPLDSRVLLCLTVIAIIGGIVYFAMRYQVRTEQERKEAIQTQLVTRIEEIRTREDLVRAFHSFAKQRIQTAQAWWTNGYVTQQFEIALPQHKNTVQTLSQLYDQARYFPMDHQLTEKQIEEAKLAFKQCS